MKQGVLLYLEDNDDDAVFFERAVKRAGFPVICHRVQNGKEGMDFFNGQGPFADRTNFPLPHFVVVDLKMPVMDGIQFIQWLRQQREYAQLPLFVFSSALNEDDVLMCAKAGAHRYFTKPCGLADFRAAVREMLSEAMAQLRMPQHHPRPPGAPGVAPGQS